MPKLGTEPHGCLLLPGGHAALFRGGPRLRAPICPNGRMHLTVWANGNRVLFFGHAWVRSPGSENLIGEFLSRTRGCGVSLGRLLKYSQGGGGFRALRAPCARPSTRLRSQPRTLGRGRSFTPGFYAKIRPFFACFSEGSARRVGRQVRPWRCAWFDLYHGLLLAVPAEQDQALRPGLFGQLQQLPAPAHWAHDPSCPGCYFAHQFACCSHRVSLLAFLC